MSKCGIYYIQNNITQQLYIGQSVDIERRKQKHIYDLRNNKHQNTHMQNSFNKYGEENFTFGIIEQCDKSKLDELEIAYMTFFNVKNTGFNICDGGVHICPDNSNEHHGLWRHDISNDKIKEMYLGDFNSTQIAEFFGCGRRTIDRRLRKIFGEDFDDLKKEKQLTNLRKVNRYDSKIKNEEIIKLANDGLNSVEISSILGCSDSTVMYRLQQIMTADEYEKYKKRNLHRKLANLRLKKKLKNKK